MATQMVVRLTATGTATVSTIVSKWLVAVMAAGIMLPLAIVALPQAPPEIGAEMQRLSLVEKEISDKFIAYQDEAAKGLIDHVELAGRVESNIFPAYLTLREDVASFLTLDYADKDHSEKVVLYLRTREESWKVLAQGSVRLMNPRRTWTTARAGDALMMTHNGTQSREHIESIELYRVFPASHTGHVVECAWTWIDSGMVMREPTNN